MMSIDLEQDAVKNEVKKINGKMTTSDLISKVLNLAEIGIVNAKQDKDTLIEAADRLYDLREKLDPRWYEYLILDDGMFLENIEDQESNWTTEKDRAMSFISSEDAEKYLEEYGDILAGGCVVQRDDVDAGGMSISFLSPNDVSSSAELKESVAKRIKKWVVSSYNKIKRKIKH